jgi:hypothetical protein
MHTPALVTQGFGDCQTRENMPAGSAGHDQGATLCHARPPRINKTAEGGLQRFALRRF